MLVPETMSQKFRGAQVALLSFGPLNLCPTEFWTPQPVPHRVLEQCNLCPAEFSGPQKNPIKHIFLLF